LKGIAADAVSRWISQHVAGTTLPFRFSLLAGGHSNLTYEVRDAAEQRMVLRRPPLGAVLATAHDMAREFHIISALATTSVPVAPAIGLCEDPEVNGAPFYLMGFVEGDVLDSASRVNASVAVERRRQLGEHVIDVLASLHAVDPDTVGLGGLGRKEAYVERQLKRFAKQWESSKTRELGAMDEIHRRLSSAVPRQHGATIVHGDYRLGNMIVAGGRVAGVLDWELCTLGDPLADLGYLLNDWTPPGEAPASADGVENPTAAGGFPDRDALIARYAERTGRDVSDLRYYRAFQAWRLGVIAEGVRARYLKGVMGGTADTDVLGRAVELLAAKATGLLSNDR
jgi:aminoglycoside phosphotransferase (APT) family kinase protein